MDWSNIGIIAALSVSCVVGVLLTALRLPGAWWIVVTAVGYGWWSDWQRVGLIFVGLLAGIALIGEAIELFSSVLIARKAGASDRAAWGSLIGGFLGMLFLSFLVPIPFVGSIVGAIVGCFLGAALAELSVRQQLSQGTKVGLFSAMGFAFGMAAKVAIAMVMTGLLLTVVVCTPTAHQVSTF